MTKEQEAEVVEFLAKVKGMVHRDNEIMRREGFVIDNLDDRWQKLVFTLHTFIAELSTDAGHILEELEYEEAQ